MPIIERIEYSRISLDKYLTEGYHTMDLCGIVTSGVTITPRFSFLRAEEADHEERNDSLGVRPEVRPIRR